jgi:hypothetical protein
VRVNVISYEPAGGWILYDYAAKLVEHLRPFADRVELSFEQQPGFEVNFHVNYGKFHEVKVAGLHSTMVTHIDAPRKFGLVTAQALGGVWGLCMSQETARRLNQLTGTQQFLNFAPPAMIAGERKRLTVMVCGRVYPDGRKNEGWAIDFFRSFEPGDLVVRAMGAGWGSHLEPLRALGHSIEHADDFDRTLYLEWLKSSDHLLYTGNDEGALSTLDALLYGVVPIVTAQGYHLEQAGQSILYATHDQLMAIAARLQRELDEINAQRERLTDWSGFARRHAEFWCERLAELRPPLKTAA